MAKVVSTSPTFGKYSDKPMNMLEEYGYKLELIPREKLQSESQIIEALSDAEALIVGVEPITKTVIEQSPKLKVIAKHGAGVDNIDLEAATNAGIVVTNAPGANRHAVADYVFGLMLSLSRGIPKTYGALKQEKWQLFVGTGIFNKTLGIIGTGKIGTEVIRRAKGFNMNIVAYDLYPNQTLVEEFGVQYVPLDELIQSADFLTLHVELTEQTRHLISTEQFKAMKQSSILINTSRGGVVDESSLYTALKEGWIQGAALDVFEIEPVGRTQLLELDNFIGTPHTAGYTAEALTEVGIITAQNIIDELTGQGSAHVVNKQGEVKS